MQDSAPGGAGPADLASYEDDRPGRRLQFSSFTFLVGFGAGAFVGVALALVAVAVTGSGSTKAPAQASVPVQVTVGAGTPAPTPDARPKSKSAQDVRLGPGGGFAIIGLLGKGDSVEVVGRDNDGQWLAIRFPPGSAGQGWIPVAGVEGLSDVERLAVALPTPLPRTISPSALPSTAISPEEDNPDTPAAGVSRTPNPLGTPTPVKGPVDLVVSRVTLLSDGRVAVTVANRGPGDLVGFTVFAQVRDLGARSEMMSATPSIFRAGQTLTLETSTFRVTGEQTIQAIVDPLGSVPDSDKSNNTTQVVLALPPTPTPTASPVSDLLN
jgi:hypothetical protein